MGFSPESSPLPATIAFQPCQIVCLEQGASRLYAEVVQTVEGRHVCWVRPLVLTIATAEASELPHQGLMQVHDLRQGSDLLLPSVLFRSAFDLEVIPLLTYLYTAEQGSDQAKQDRTRHHYLNQFVRQVWQAHPEVFQTGQPE